MREKVIERVSVYGGERERERERGGGGIDRTLAGSRTLELLSLY